MLEDIEVLCHSSIKISKRKVIYIDPYRVNGSYKDADYIFITHDHYDHFSEEDILKIKKKSTIIICTEDIVPKALKLGFEDKNILKVIPNMKYELNELKFETVPAYNNEKIYHPKSNGWVGYIIEINKVKYYIAGDTDITEENKRVKCDVAFVPVGDKFTMNFKDAAQLVNIIEPSIAVPIHYGSIVGTREDAELFIKLLHKKIKGEILIK